MSSLEFILLFSITPVGALLIAALLYFWFYRGSPGSQ
jgi:hypothetical protein